MNTPNDIEQSEGAVAVRSGDLLCRSLLGQIDIRRRDAQRELKSAIANKEWSKVAGWDGIDIGLMMAEKTIKDELRHNAGAEGPNSDTHQPRKDR